MDTLAYIIACLLLAGLILCYCSVFEWWFHKNIMHRRVWGLGKIFEAHALKHHRVYGSDETYSTSARHPEGIRMWWWAGPVLVAVSSLPALAVSAITGWWLVLIMNAFACTAYFVTYEVSHWCMHNPKGRWIERLRLFKRMNEHHWRHHKHPGVSDFNVVFPPLADWLCGTLQRGV